MSADTPCPTFSNPPRILDIRQSVQMPQTEMKGVTYAAVPPLAFLLLANRLGELYETIFPDHPEWLGEEVVNWSDEEAVADAVGRFLSRVNVLFPVHDDIWDIDLEVIEWWLYEIPVMPLGHDYWYDDWDNFTEPAPYLLHMSHSRGDEESPFMRDEFADMYPDHLVPGDLEPCCLVDALRQGEMPCPELAALPDLILMLDHNTGNAWLDVGECALADGGGYPLWSAENAAWLAEEWRKARPILDGITALLNWKSDSPEAVVEKITAVRDILLEAYKRMEQDEPADTAMPPTPA